MDKKKKEEIAQFIGDSCIPDPGWAGYIWGMDDETEELQMIGEVRGWGAIQNLFKEKGGAVDLEKAEKFQDDLCAFIAEAVDEKIKKVLDETS